MFKEFFFSEVGGIGVKSLRKCQNAAFFFGRTFSYYISLFFWLKSRKLGQALKTFDLGWLCSAGKLFKVIWVKVYHMCSWNLFILYVNYSFLKVGPLSSAFHIST